MNNSNRRLAALCAFLLVSYGASAQPVADTIYMGGPILSIDDSLPRPEGVAVRDGTILEVGTLEAVRSIIPCCPW